MSEYAPESALADDITLIKPLKDDGFAETRLVEYQGQRWLYKIYRFRFWWGKPLQPLANRFMRHEIAIGHHLEGIEGVATKVVRVDERSFLREWIEGSDLRQRRRAGNPPGEEFFATLRSIIEQIHARGVAYNDLAKQDNVVVTENNRPVLIDFQISSRFYSGKFWPRRVVSNWLKRRLQYEDLRHIAKLKRRVLPKLITPEEEALSRRKHWSGIVSRKLITEPGRWLKRLLYPSGSNETFRFRRKSKPDLGSKN